MKNWKKTMVLAMALCLLFAAGSGVFAIDLGNGFSLDGQLLTGVRADTKYVEADDENKTTIYLNNDDDGQIDRFRVTATYQGDWGGIKGRWGIEGGDNGWGVNGASAYAWANGFNKLITVSAGGIFTAQWGSSGYVGKSLDDRPGIKLEVKPIEGLNVGFGLNVPATGIDRKPELETAFKDGLYFGAKYTSAAFTFNAAGRLTYGKDEAGDYKSGIEALFGVKVPLAPLTIDIDGWFASLEAADSENGFFGYHVIDGKPSGYVPGFRIAPRVTYSQDALTAYLVADIRTVDSDVQQANTKAAGDARIEVRAQGTYKISDIWQPFFRVGVANIAAFEYGPLYVRFGNTFKVAPNASISLYDQIDNIGGSEAAGTDHIANRVYAGFNYTF